MAKTKPNEVLIISDSDHWLNIANRLLKTKAFGCKYYVYRSHATLPNGGGMNMKDDNQAAQTEGKFSVVFSLHCQQKFSPFYVEKHNCVNLHPGYLPMDRGWVPYVHAIAEGRSTGATLHYMTNKMDAGRLIDRTEVSIGPHQTCDQVYRAVQHAEEMLFFAHLGALVAGEKPYMGVDTAAATDPVYTKDDYRKLCCLNDLSDITGQQLYNRLRALTYKDDANAWFTGEYGRKYSIAITVEDVDDE